MPKLAPKISTVDTFRATLINKACRVRLKNSEEYRAYHGEKFKLTNNISLKECEAWKRKYKLL